MSPPTVVPTIELKLDATMAFWAWPCWVSGNPSKAVAMADGVPGVLTRHAGIASENMAATYSAPSIARPWLGGRTNVKGSTSAVPMVAVKPGSAPTVIPMSTPTAMISRDDGATAIPSPSSIASFSPQHGGGAAATVRCGAPRRPRGSYSSTLRSQQLR